MLYQPFADFGNEVLQRIPFLKTIDEALKDLVGSAGGQQKKFDRPVLVRMVQGSDLEKLGFITQDDMEPPRHTRVTRSANLPATYTPGAATCTSCLRRTCLESTPAPGEVMKFIVSGGVASVEGRR